MIDPFATNQQQYITLTDNLLPSDTEHRFGERLRQIKNRGSMIRLITLILNIDEATCLPVEYNKCHR